MDGIQCPLSTDPPSKRDETSEIATEEDIPQPEMDRHAKEVMCKNQTSIVKLQYG